MIITTLLHLIPEWFTFLMLAYRGCPAKEAVKQVLLLYQLNETFCKHDLYVISMMSVHPIANTQHGMEYIMQYFLQ